MKLLFIRMITLIKSSIKVRLLFCHMPFNFRFYRILYIFQKFGIIRRYHHFALDILHKRMRSYAYTRKIFFRIYIRYDYLKFGGAAFDIQIISKPGCPIFWTRRQFYLFHNKFSLGGILIINTSYKGICILTENLRKIQVLGGEVLLFIRI